MCVDFFYIYLSHYFYRKYMSMQTWRALKHRLYVFTGRPLMYLESRTHHSCCDYIQLLAFLPPVFFHVSLLKYCFRWKDSKSLSFSYPLFLFFFSVGYLCYVSIFSILSLSLNSLCFYHFYALHHSVGANVQSWFFLPKQWSVLNQVVFASAPNQTLPLAKWDNKKWKALTNDVPLIGAENTN